MNGNQTGSLIGATAIVVASCLKNLRTPRRSGPGVRRLDSAREGAGLTAGVGSELVDWIWI